MMQRMITLGPISVIGKEGLCTKGNSMVSQLWEAANSHFEEVAPLAMREKDGSFVGFWGLMSDRERRFLPWEDDFSTGLYLAGVEVASECAAPEGWVKWTVPERTYLVVEIENGAYQAAFRYGLEELPRQSCQLSGAVCDYTEPKTGKNFLFFPCEKTGANL